MLHHFLLLYKNEAKKCDDVIWSQTRPARPQKIIQHFTAALSTTSAQEKVYLGQSASRAGVIPRFGHSAKLASQPR